MVGKIVLSFVAFVGLLYVLRHPDHAIGLLQMIIDGAYGIADGLSHLDPSGGKK